MSVEIRPVKTRRELRRFVLFPEKLYRDNPYYIPPLVFMDMFRNYSKAGVKWAETNAILESNLKNQGQFRDFEHECKKRRRSYIKKLEY